MYFISKGDCLVRRTVPRITTCSRRPGTSGGASQQSAKGSKHLKRSTSAFAAARPSTSPGLTAPSLSPSPSPVPARKSSSYKLSSIPVNTANNRPLHPRQDRDTDARADEGAVGERSRPTTTPAQVKVSSEGVAAADTEVETIGRVGYAATLGLHVAACKDYYVPVSNYASLMHCKPRRQTAVIVSSCVTHSHSL